MSGICAFFGHRNTVITAQLEEKITQTLRELIAQGIDEFWCCEQGNFDWICNYTVHQLKNEFPFINICLVCAYNPNKYSKIRQDSLFDMFDDLIYTDEIANGPKRFSIIRRNHYIAENADVIVCYVENKIGGAHEAMQYAQRFDKRIINLAE